MEWLFIAIPVITVLLLLAAGYVKAPPDTAYIISGFSKPRILIGKAGIRIPFLERMDKLSLKMFSVDVKTTDYVPNAEYINVKVDATVKIRIGQTPEMMTLASKFFLNEKEGMIIARIQDTLEGNMREIVGQMRLEEMVTDRKAFGERVQENAIPDLEKMGLEMISFNVQSFSDQNNVIEDLGIDNISQIKKGAAIAKAQADRDIAISQAQAAKEANDARVQADMEIAEKQTSLAIRQAELKQQSDVKKAEADAAYKIQEQEQRKTIEVTSANANIAKAEREAELKAREVEVKKQTLDAEIRAKADAERYRQEQEAHRGQAPPAGLHGAGLPDRRAGHGVDADHRAARAGPLRGDDHRRHSRYPGARPHPRGRERGLPDPHLPGSLRSQRFYRLPRRTPHPRCLRRTGSHRKRYSLRGGLCGGHVGHGGEP